jgi:hypothetical protein
MIAMPSTGASLEAGSWHTAFYGKKARAPPSSIRATRALILDQGNDMPNDTGVIDADAFS